MAIRPFNVLFVAADRAVLRHGSRLLTVFGYHVRTANTLVQATKLFEAQNPDILLLDGAPNREDLLGLCRQASARKRCVYKMMLVDDIAPDDAVRCLEAGVDDFLGRPLEYGELLARLRTAARVLEFERRVSNYAHQDKLPLLDSQRFLSRAATELTAAHTARKSIACAMIELDLAAAIQAERGPETLESLEDQLLSALRQDSGEVLAIGHLGARRFGVLIADTAAKAAALVDKIREQLAASELPAGLKPIVPTLSCGISDSSVASQSADEMVAQSEASLLVAQSSGGDFVARYGQFADEDAHWTELAKNGALFENTLARDIMVPCTTVVSTKHPLARAAALFEQTQLQALPVVDDEGKLAGLLTASGVRLRMAADDSADRPVSSFMTSDMASFDERTSLPALIDYFTQESPLAIVIVHKGRPSGLVTPSSLATLSEQLTTATFSETAHRSDRNGLIVSNLCGVDS